MFKKYFYIIFAFFVLSNNTIFANGPELGDHKLPGAGIGGNDILNEKLPNFVVNMIQYVAVIAVISLMLGGIMYMVALGEEEKVKKAKNWVIWSLVGVFLSVSAWGIIEFITKIEL